VTPPPQRPPLPLGEAPLCSIAWGSQHRDGGGLVVCSLCAVIAAPGCHAWDTRVLGPIPVPKPRSTAPPRRQLHLAWTTCPATTGALGTTVGRRACEGHTVDLASPPAPSCMCRRVQSWVFPMHAVLLVGELERAGKPVDWFLIIKAPNSNRCVQGPIRAHILRVRCGVINHRVVEHASVPGTCTRTHCPAQTSSHGPPGPSTATLR
jgi:hypothetical protein